jgi:hypothetical protein
MSGSRSAAHQNLELSFMRPARFCELRGSKALFVVVLPAAVRSISASVITPSNNKASCNSSALAACGQASSHTRWMAAPSRMPKPASPCDSVDRRVYTARVRRSSNGALSKNA